ncbi:Purine nucleoside phosphorylase [uncultured archaeon]|nr:Purine nucleoside phosphorylase [uncultured archaeon]
MLDYMTYPQFNGKHLEKALFSPEDYIKWDKISKRWNGRKPSRYIFIYSSKLLNRFKRKYKPKKIVLYNAVTVYQYKNIGVVRMTGIGAPHAATILEEIIALGGKEILNMGTAGGLANFGTYLCDKAIRDEGTSYHYAPHENFSYPNKALTASFGEFLKSKKIDFEFGATWTIDAPYRETKAEINHYKKAGVKTVEMETSALFTIAKIRKVKLAAAFIVSDVLGKKWDPQFDTKKVNIDLNKIFDLGVEFLLKK